MKKLIELDVALEGLENLNAISFYETNEHSKEAYIETKNMLKALPTVDAVKVIQCKDCKYKKYYQFPPKYDIKLYCDKHEKVMEEHDYCSWGKRKDGNA